MKACLALSFVTFALIASVQAKDTPKSGDVVHAQRLPDGWFHGNRSTGATIEFHVVFDYSDEGDQPVALIAVDRVPAAGEVAVATRVLAVCADYPGTVKAVTGNGEYSIIFDNGDLRDVPLKDLRLPISRLRL